MSTAAKRSPAENSPFRIHSRRASARRSVWVFELAPVLKGGVDIACNSTAILSNCGHFTRHNGI